MSELTPANPTPCDTHRLARVRHRLWSAQAMLVLTLCLLALCTIMLAGQPLATASMPAHAIAYTVDVNAADARMLSLLPGIGPGLAAQIIAHREQHGPFAREEDLLAVPRIGPLTLARIQPWLHINPPPQAD